MSHWKQLALGHTLQNSSLLRTPQTVNRIAPKEHPLFIKKKKNGWREKKICLILLTKEKKMLQHSPGVVGKATASLGFMPGL